MTTFEWSGPAGRGTYNYLYNEDDEGYSRSIGMASVYPQRDHYRVITAHYLDELIPAKAYILNHKYPTLAAAKRAVERKIPGLIAVLKIQGGINI
jgi:hypothetical protein